MKKIAFSPSVVASADSQKEATALAQKIAKAISLKIVSFYKETYRNGAETGSFVYNLEKGATAEGVYKALNALGFKIPQNIQPHINHDSGKFITDSASSATHLVSFQGEHGGNPQIRIEPR